MITEAKEYYLCYANTTLSLADCVNSHLKQGWVLYGPTFVDQYKGVCQAVVKLK